MQLVVSTENQVACYVYGLYLDQRLGQFMAHEMNLELKKMICIASSAKLGNNKITKTSLRSLEQELRKIVKET